VSRNVTLKARPESVLRQRLVQPGTGIGRAREKTGSGSLPGEGKEKPERRDGTAPNAG